MDKLSMAIIAMEAHVACSNDRLRQAWDIIHAKLAEENGSLHNSDYVAALKVFNEWFFNYRGASNNTGDFCEWLDKRLHSSTNVT